MWAAAGGPVRSAYSSVNVMVVSVTVSASLAWPGEFSDGTSL